MVIVKMLILHNPIKLLILLLVFPCVAFGNAGEIGKIKGSGVLERGKDVIDGNTGVTVQSMDTAVTVKGSMRIDFIDDTRVDITDHSRLLIDDFVYDPNTGKGSLGLRATLGTVRYASGQIAKNYQQNVKIKTPSATIGVRGTDFVMVVDEIGGSMITLLPSCDVEGNCYTGEIEVETDAGFVIMNQAFQTTITSISSRAPTPPLVLDLDERMISQLIILRKKSPYEEEEDEIRRRTKNIFDFLGFDFLEEFDGLELSALDRSTQDLWHTELDESSYLLNEVLYNMLDMLNKALTALLRDELSAQNVEFFRTQEDGLDPITGIYYELKDETHLVRREDNAADNFFQLELSRLNSYSLDLSQQDWTYYGYSVGAGNNNSINIIQRTY
jgi:hypothetical protein